MGLSAKLPLANLTVPRNLYPGRYPLVVERSFAWLTRYRRLNTIFERTREHLVAFVEIAFASLLSRRLNCFGTEELCA